MVRGSWLRFTRESVCGAFISSTSVSVPPLRIVTASRLKVHAVLDVALRLEARLADGLEGRGAASGLRERRNRHDGGDHHNKRRQGQTLEFASCHLFRPFWPPSWRRRGRDQTRCALSPGQAVASYLEQERFRVVPYERAIGRE